MYVNTKIIPYLVNCLIDFVQTNFDRRTWRNYMGSVFAIWLRNHQNKYEMLHKENFHARHLVYIFYYFIYYLYIIVKKLISNILIRYPQGKSTSRKIRLQNLLFQYGFILHNKITSPTEVSLLCTAMEGE